MRAHRVAQPIVHQALLTELREAYGRYTQLPLWACDKLMRIVERSDEATLTLMAEADINFVSTFATVEINQRAASRA